MIRRIDRFFEDHVASFTKTLQDLEEHIAPDEEPTSDELTGELTDRINESLAECARLETVLADEQQLLRQVQQNYRDAIWPWLGKSWFMRRALEKPRGYPGDYEILTGIYDGVTKSRGLGGYLDRYFLATTLARAVRSRMWAVREFLLQEFKRRTGDVTVLNVACGPCREFTHGFVPEHNGSIRLIGVDNDPLALEFTRSFVAPLIRDSVDCEFVRYNALRMTSTRRNIESFGRPDIIYSVGLCDYISDRVLIPILKGWRESLNEDGVVFVAFKDAERYETPEYQWLVDWYFLQRKESDCRRLFAEAGYDMQRLALHRDGTGVILNYTGHSLAPSAVRIDEAESGVRPPRIVTSDESREKPSSNTR